MQFTEHAFSPEIFRKWTAIAAVAGAAERRIWVKSGKAVTFPNLYTLLVAPPAVGKQVIDDVRDLWRETLEPGTKNPAFKVAPDSVTKASLIDTIAKARSTRLPPSGSPYVYHSLLVAAEEFPVLLPSYDLEFMGVLNKIYNNAAAPYSESRRTGAVREVSIDHAQLNILAGVQPGWLQSTFPPEAWTTGFSSRTIMVYASATPLIDIFAEIGDLSSVKAKLLAKLALISTKMGELRWDDDAQTRMGEWHLAGGPPVPTHSRLTSYAGRRTLHLIKLCCVSAISRGEFKRITLFDLERAWSWLFEVEKFMPDIFRAMIGKSDNEVLEEFHSFMLSAWVRNKQAPIHERMIFAFLRERVPSEKIIKLVEIAERSHMIERFAGTSSYKPLPKYARGIE